MLYAKHINIIKICTYYSLGAYYIVIKFYSDNITTLRTQQYSRDLRGFVRLVTTNSFNQYNGYLHNHDNV